MGAFAVAVGAHPDDIEIAAAGTVARLVRSGADVLAIVVSDETDAAVASVRRREALHGLRALGVAEDNIAFLGQPDRSIDVAAGASALAVELERRGLTTCDVAISHTPHDVHSDHRTVAEIVRRVLPTSPTFGMAVVNSVGRDFCPNVFVDYSELIDLKHSSLLAYRSQDQLGRIRHDDICRMDRGFAATFGVDRVEGFEIRNEMRDQDRAKGTLSALGRCVSDFVLAA